MPDVRATPRDRVDIRSDRKAATLVRSARASRPIAPDPDGCGTLHSTDPPARAPLLEWPANPPDVFRESPAQSSVLLDEVSVPNCPDCNCSAVYEGAITRAMFAIHE